MQILSYLLSRIRENVELNYFQREQKEVKLDSVVTQWLQQNILRFKRSFEIFFLNHINDLSLVCYHSLSIKMNTGIL